MLDVAAHTAHAGTLIVGIPETVAVGGNVDLIGRQLAQPLGTRSAGVSGCGGLRGADAQLLYPFLILALGVEGLSHRQRGRNVLAAWMKRQNSG